MSRERGREREREHRRELLTETWSHPECPLSVQRGREGGPASDHFTQSAGCVDTAPGYTNTL